MTFQALAVFLFSWTVSEDPLQEHEDNLPRWERHPAEQRYLREQASRETQLRTRFPQSW